MNRSRQNSILITITAAAATSIFFGLQLTGSEVKWKAVVVIQAPDAVTASRFQHVVPLQTSCDLKILREYGQGHRGQMTRRRGQSLPIPDAPELAKAKDDNQEGRLVTSTIIQPGGMAKGLVEVGSKLCDDCFLPLPFVFRRLHVVACRCCLYRLI